MKKISSALIIDPSYETREQLVSLLKKSNIDVLQARDEKEANKCLADNDLEMIFVSATLGQRSAAKFISKNITNNPDLLMVVLANRDEAQEELIDCFRVGADDFIELPVSTENVHSVLGGLIGRVRRKLNRKFAKELLIDAELKLTLENRSAAVLPTVNQIKNLLAGRLSSTKLSFVELALDEAIRNAYEHGNMGLSSEEKDKLCQENKLEQYLASKENENLHKRIRVAVSIKPQEFVCIIEDEGKGFNWKESPFCIEEDPVEAALCSGRGIYLIKRVFDCIEFNDKGNRITLHLKLDEAPTDNI